MKKIVFILAILIAVLSCKTETKKLDDKQQSIESESIRTPVLALNEFDTEAAMFVNKEVLIHGIVDLVCKHGGKKILLVTDGSQVHITSDERFDETLKGSEITVSGIVLEERIDEAYCLKMEENNIKSHSEGASNQEQFDAKTAHIQQYRDQMKAENKAYVSNYSLKYVSHSEVE